jgi:hypothetical protein
VLPALTAAALVVTGQACSSFGATSEGDAMDSGTSNDAAANDAPANDAAANDAPANDAAGLDAAPCLAPATLLSFEDVTFPPSGFTRDVAAGGQVTRSPNGGVGGTGALQSDLVVPNNANGPWARIFKRFDVAPAEIELSYDFTAPTAPALYVSAGCELSFHAANDQINTSISAATFNGEGPRLQVEYAGPDAGLPIESSMVASTPGQFHHITLRVAIDAAGTTAQARSLLDGLPRDLSFPLLVVPTAVTLACGGYADSATANVSILVDNVSFAICRTRP